MFPGQSCILGKIVWRLSRMSGIIRDDPWILADIRASSRGSVASSRMSVHPREDPWTSSRIVLEPSLMCKVSNFWSQASSRVCKIDSRGGFRHSRVVRRHSRVSKRSSRGCKIDSRGCNGYSRGCTDPRGCPGTSADVWGSSRMSVDPRECLGILANVRYGS
jgi:hypothetical protein